MQTLLTLLHGMDWGWNGWTLLGVGSDLLAFASLPSILLRRRGRPVAALGWLLAVFTLPLVGAALWWLLGRTQLAHRRRRRQEARARLCRIGPQAVEGGLLACCTPDGEAGAGPWRVGNEVRLLVDAKQAYPRIEELIGGADRSIELLFFVWRPDTIGRRWRDLLTERARAGVRVRLLVDGFGSSAADRFFFAPLIDAGGAVRWFLPPRLLRRGFDLNFRNHRKLVVVDGERAIAGGLNVGDEHVGAWHDLMFEVRGPTVDDLREVFLDDWYFVTGESTLPTAAVPTSPPPDASGLVECQVLASGPDQRDNTSLDALFELLAQATDRAWLMTPYFVPDPAIVQALRAASIRGADVRLLLPRRVRAWGDRLTRTASRSWFDELLRSGVRIDEFEPAFVHAKALLVDEELVLIGSANIDSRSLRLNFELGCLIRSVELNRDLAELFEGDLVDATPVPEDFAQREGRLQALTSSALHLLSPLL